MRHRATFLVTFLLAAVLAAPSAARTQIDDHLPSDLREWVDGHGPLRVGYVRGSAPVVVLDDEARAVGGYAYEIVELMALRLGVDVEHVVYDAPGDDAAALVAGDLDIVAAGLGARAETLSAVEAVEPIAWVPIMFVGRSAVQALDPSTAEGLTFTSVPGTLLEEQVRQANPRLVYVPIEGLDGGLRAVDAGEVDLYLGPLALIGWQLRQTGLDLGPVGAPVDLFEVSPWARPDSEALQILEIGRSLLTDSELAVLHVRWTGFDLTDPASERPRWLLPALGASAFAALVLGSFAFVLRRRVQAATSDLQDLNHDLERRINARTADLAAANARLAESNDALTKFARTAAHDLRGPVAAISGMATLLRTLEVDDQQRDEMLATVESSSGKLGKMIDSLLDEAINAGGAPPTMSTGDFAGWLRDVTRAEVDAIGGTLQIDVDEGNLEADLRVVRRSALNLVGNAIKYAANPTGTVIRAGLHRRDDHYLLAVDDNGPGVPTKDRERIFERGIRRDHDRRGRGLGLADVRDLAQSVGGTVVVSDSELGGARFEVVIPFASASATPASLPEIDAAGT